jgi:putative spermidine/putrescine transport system permease protein
MAADQGLTVGPRVTRGASLLHRHPRLRLAAVLGAPLVWLGVVYVGSLAALLVASLWVQDSFTGQIFRTWTLESFRQLATEPLYRTVLARTTGIAAAVTVIDLVLALPVAFFMAKVARPRTARLLVVACLMPLWASYLVKVYAWRLLVIDNGVLPSTVGASPGLGLTAATLTLAYLWLPFMILPIYSGLERLPDSLLEASEDAGARPWRTFRSVVWPLILPSVAAGSIFTFSLTLGDYITIKIVGGASQMLGSLVYDQQSLNLPLAAATATFSVVVMAVYLALVRRTGALEQL